MSPELSILNDCAKSEGQGKRRKDFPCIIHMIFRKENCPCKWKLHDHQLSLWKKKYSKLKKIFSSPTWLPFLTENMVSVNLCRNCPLTAKLSEPQAPNLQVQSLLCPTDPEAEQTWTPRTIHSIFNFLICKMENLILSSLYRLRWEEHLGNRASQHIVSLQQTVRATVYIMLFINSINLSL